jgi:hypothetical protein
MAGDTLGWRKGGVCFPRNGGKVRNGNFDFDEVQKKMVPLRGLKEKILRGLIHGKQKV